MGQLPTDEIPQNRAAANQTDREHSALWNATKVHGLQTVEIDGQMMDVPCINKPREAKTERENCDG